MDKKRTAIYIRVSTLDQEREGFSLGNQFEACRNYVLSRNDLQLVTPTIESAYKDVESGFSTERKGYLNLLKDAKLRKIDSIIVWRLDRFSRNASFGGHDLDTLENIGVKVISVVAGEIDSKTSTGKMITTFQLAIAEHERNKQKENVVPGMKTGVRKGHWQGARYAPYGYHYNKKEKLLEEVTGEINAIKTMFKLSAIGTSICSITRQLYDLGYRNRRGKPYTTKLIGDILKRRIYADGKIVWRHKDNRPKKDWEIITSENPVVKPIIDGDTWDRTQETLNKNSNLFNQKDRRPKSTYIMQGVLKCRYCDGNMQGRRLISNHRTGTKKEWYHCGTNTSNTRKACRGQNVKSEDVHEQAYQILRIVVEDKELIELTKQEIKETLEMKNPDLSKNVESLKKELAKIESQQQKCLELHYNEALTVEQFKVENLRLVKEAETLKNELKIAEGQLYQSTQFKVQMDTIFELLSNFDYVYSKLSPSNKKLLFRNIFQYIIMEEGRFKRKKNIEKFSLFEPFATIYDTKMEEHEMEPTYQWKDQSITFAPSVVR